MLDISLPSEELEQAITDLVRRGTAESVVMDYKADRYPTNAEKPTANREIAKDISAFANAEGGQIVIGVEERKGVATAARGFVPPEWDEGLRIEDVATSGISPKIGSLRVLPVGKKGDASRGFVVVSVPQSLSAPHMVVADGDYRYYTRRNLKSERMGEPEVRVLYETRYRALERVETFLNSLERLQWPGAYPDFVHELLSEGKRQVELVCCPLLAVDDRITPADPLAYEWARGFVQTFRSPEASIADSTIPRPAIEGIRFDWQDVRGRVFRRGQVFRNGSLRFVAIWKLLKGEGGRAYIHGLPVVELIRFFTRKSADVLRQAEYFGEVRLRFRIFDVGQEDSTVFYLIRRGRSPDDFDNETSRGWAQPQPLDELATTFELQHEPDAPARRLANHLWNCFGWPRCDLWDENGNWVGSE